MPPRRPWLAFLLLWLAGVALRLTVLAIPPILPDIQASLGLSGTQIGTLNGIPVVMFGAAAVPTAFLMLRIGALPTLIAGIVIAAIAGALRGAYPSVLVLYVATLIMAGGIAIMQPTLPVLVRNWTPANIGFATALYTNGLIVGEILPAALTLPLVQPAVGHQWPWSLAFWSLPMVAIAVAVAIGGRRLGRGAIAAVNSSRWLPDFGSKITWQLGLLTATANALYFCTNAFVPPYVVSLGRPDLVAGALVALNLGQLPASVLLLILAPRLERKAWPFVVFGVFSVAAVLGLILFPGPWIMLFCGVIGFVCAAALTLCFTLPALLSAPEDVGRASAGMLAISYTLAMVVSVACGVAWDLSGRVGFAFLPLAASLLPLFVIPPLMDFGRKMRAEVGR